MVKDIWDNYCTWMEILLSMKWWREVETAMVLDLEVLWGYNSLTTNPLRHELGIDQDDIWSLYSEKVRWFQGECLCPRTFTSPTKKNLMTDKMINEEIE